MNNGRVDRGLLWGVITPNRRGSSHSSVMVVWKCKKIKNKKCLIQSFMQWTFSAWQQILFQTIFWVNPPPGDPGGDMVHCQGPKTRSKYGWWPQSGVLTLLWCFWRQITSAGRQERRSTGCAILDAAIVFERAPNFNSFHLRNIQPRLSPPACGAQLSRDLYSHICPVNTSA